MVVQEEMDVIPLNSRIEGGPQDARAVSGKRPAGCICFHSADALCQSRRDGKIRPNQMNRAMGTRGRRATFLRYRGGVIRVFVSRDEGVKRFSRELAKQILIAKIALVSVYPFFFRPAPARSGSS